MTKLNEIIAVVNGKKTKTQKELTELYKHVQKPDLFNGLARTYRPLDEDGETFPSEYKKVQLTAKRMLQEFVNTVSDTLDCILTQDTGNLSAVENVTIDGNVVLHSVPVTHLLLLEKWLVDLYTYVSKLPTLDEAENWHVTDKENGVYESDVTKTVKTKKVPKTLVKFAGDQHHPPQVDVFTEDIKVGEWDTKKLSGAMTAENKTVLLNKIVKFQDAVKIAREKANSTTVEHKHVYEKMLNRLLEV